MRGKSRWKRSWKTSGLSPRSNGGQDEPVLEVQDRRLGDGGVHDGKNVLVLQQVEKPLVVLSHQPKDAKLTGAVEPLIADLGAYPLLHVVHRATRLLEEPLLEHALDDRIADETEARHGQLEPIRLRPTVDG